MTTETEISKMECDDFDSEQKREGTEYVRDMLCKIVFYSGWGDNESYEQCCALGYEIYLMPEQFSEKRPGYKFLGWGIAMNDDVVYYDQDLYKPTECPSYLYGQWKKTEDDEVEINDNEACIVGYDPFPVVFRDMSDVRSFKTKYWRWDFGDSIVYGCDTKSTATADFDDANSEYCRFELPGDDAVHRVGSANGFCVCSIDQNGVETCTTKSLWKESVDYFHSRLDKCIMNIDYDDNWKSYHYNGAGLKHFTGINFKSNTESTSGSGFIDYADYDVGQALSGQHRFKRIPGNTYATYIDVDGIEEKILPDQCERVSCEQEYDFGNSVAHIYKGPGMYYSTMVCSSENQSPKIAGLQGMELESYIYDSDVLSGDKQKIAGCWINVLPVCPCVSAFHVYGTYDVRNNSWASDGLRYDDASRRFLTITDSNFSCDDAAIKNSMGNVDWNCQIEFTDFDGNKRITNCVSGYAPFLQVGASGLVISRSLPVTGAWFDWSDWNTDYMEKDHGVFGKVVRGWPTWATKPLDAHGEVDWSKDDEEVVHSISGDHVYTLPGLYSIGISPEFDDERIRKYMPTVKEYEYCAEEALKKSASGCCVLVVEIPPKFDQSRGIDWTEPASLDGKETVVTGIHANIRAGSYPISRIDWDFGDGSEILTISTEGFRVNNKDVIDNFDYGTVNYDTKLNDVHPMAHNRHTISNGYLNGNPKRNCNECKMSSDDEFEYSRYPYARLDARDYTIDHKYVRTSVDDHSNGYTIKCSAYAENTNTCVVYEQHVLESGAGLPDFGEEEGFVEMVDIRSDISSETNVVLQSQHEDRLYVNRIVDMDGK